MENRERLVDIDEHVGFEGSILYYTQIQLERLEYDFDAFCRKFNEHIVSSAEHYRDGVVFNIHLNSEYFLIITSEDKKVKGFQIVNCFINSMINDSEVAAHFIF